MARKISTNFFESHRTGWGWFLLFAIFCFLIHINVIAQTQFGLSINVGNRQHYLPSIGFKSSLAPSACLSISTNKNLNDKWIFRYGAVAGIVGYKVNVVLIDTLGPNGDVSPFPEYSTFFASGEFLLGRRMRVFKRNLSVGSGVGVTGYASSTPQSIFRVKVFSPNNKLIPLFDAEMYSPANRYSMLWKAGAFYNLTPAFTLGIEYVYHKDPFANGSFIFYHTVEPLSGAIEIYQRELRIELFYTLAKVRSSVE